MEVKQQQFNPFVTPLDTYGDSVLALTDPTEELRKMQIALRSQFEKQDGTVEKFGEQLLNDIGIQQVTLLAQAWVNRNCILSNMKEKWIYHHVLHFVKVLITDLMMNREKYEIEDTVARKKVVEVASGYAYQAMLRAMEEGEKRFLKGSQHEIRTTQENVEQRGGLLSSLSGWGKKKLGGVP